MYYWKDFNLFHFHIPKTGGTTTIEFFDRVFGKGQLFKTKKERYHDVLSKKMYLFFLNSLSPLISTNVRNPFEFLISLYYHSRKGYNTKRFLREVFHNRQAAAFVLLASFHEFVDWYVEEGLSFKDYLFVNGKLPDKLHINRLENLSGDLEKLFSKIKVEFKHEEIGHFNAISRGTFSCHYTSDLENKVRRKFEWTFKNFYPDI